MSYACPSEALREGGSWCVGVRVSLAYPGVFYVTALEC